MRLIAATLSFLLACNLLAESGAGPGVTIDDLISEVDKGNTASQITQQVYATQGEQSARNRAARVTCGKGACCTVAITSESRAWMLRISQQPAASQQDFHDIAQDATACCRTSMCGDLKSEFRCLWLPFCEWESAPVAGLESSKAGTSGAAGIQGSGECLWKKEQAASSSPSPEDSNSLSRTIVYIHRKLREKEEELDRNSAALAAEENKLNHEEQVQHLTKEAEGLVIAGHYAEAERVLQEALNQDPDGKVSRGEEEKRARESEGLKDLGLASSLLGHLEGLHTPGAPTPTRASSSSAAARAAAGNSLKSSASTSTSTSTSARKQRTHRTHRTQSPEVKATLRGIAALCILLTAYITVGTRRGWRGTGAAGMAVELEEAGVPVCLSVFVCVCVCGLSVSVSFCFLSVPLSRCRTSLPSARSGPPHTTGPNMCSAASVSARAVPVGECCEIKHVSGTNCTDAAGVSL
eukprot:726747-Rhodomonas_salina.1